MKAKYVLLNHFSQRYPKLPRVQPLAAANDGETASRPKVALAFDLMTLPLRSFEKTSSYTDAMESLFAELAAEDPEDGEMEEKDDKKPAKGKSGKQPAEKQQVKKLRDMDESELTNRQKKKLERAGNWPKPEAEGGKKRPSDGEDVEMEKPAVKRTKSEIVAQGNQHD
jgi:ribonuclease Z